jgi:flavin-dependent dehydrogenase
MKKTIIVGSGPVGSFMAVICELAGFEVVVYEKRSEFTRYINLKIEKDFFKTVQEIMSRLNIQSDFFEKFNDFLHEHNDKIVLNHIEKN